MEYAKKVKKVEYRYFGKDGRWESTGIVKLRKGCEWSIPLNTEEMKKFFNEKLKEDIKWAKSKKMKLAISFGYRQGQAGVLI